MLTLYPINDFYLYGLNLRIKIIVNTDTVLIIAQTLF